MPCSSVSMAVLSRSTGPRALDRRVGGELDRHKNLINWSLVVGQPTHKVPSNLLIAFCDLADKQINERQLICTVGGYCTIECKVADHTHIHVCAHVHEFHQSLTLAWSKALLTTESSFSLSFSSALLYCHVRTYINMYKYV